MNDMLGYDPANLTVDFVVDIRIRTHKNVVLRHNHSNPISTGLTLFDKIE